MPFDSAQRRSARTRAGALDLSRAGALESIDVPSVSFCTGFSGRGLRRLRADGLGVWATHEPQSWRARQSPDGVEQAERSGTWKPSMPMRRSSALMRTAQMQKPVVIADTQDNPGAAAIRTDGMLRALVATTRSARRSTVVGSRSALAAHRAGPGASITVNLGERRACRAIRHFAERPGRAHLRRQADRHGPLTAREDESRPCARLAIAHKVIVTSEKVQLADQEMYRSSASSRPRGVLVNKSSVHFRADSRPSPRSARCACARCDAGRPVDAVVEEAAQGRPTEAHGPVFQ